MKMLVYWHDMLLPHSAYMVQAFDRSPSIDEAILLGPESSTTNEVFNQPEGDTHATNLNKAKLVQVKTYRSRPLCCTFSEYLKHIKSYQPDIVIIIDEALSANVLLAGLANQLASRPARVLFYGFDNIYAPFPFRYFREKPTVSRLFTVVRKALRYLMLDKLMMPFRKRWVYGGLTSYRECTELIHRYRWHPPIREQWWPINLSLFLQSASSLSKEIKESQAADKTYTLAFIGRFVKEKGIEDLIRAMQHLPDYFTLLLIGAGERKSGLEALIAESCLLHRVQIVPPQNQTSLMDYFPRIDLLVLPSRTDYFWKEQYGRVLVEAMASGTLVLGSDSGSIPYIIGDQRLVFKEGDVSDLVRKISAIFEKSLHQHDVTLANFKEKALRADPQVFIEACCTL